MKGPMIAFATAITLMISFAYSDTSDSFTWLDLGKNPKMYQEAKKAFSEELRPDIPEKVKPYMPMLYKYIAYIGVYNNVALVIIGYRESVKTPKSYDAFSAYSFDPNTHKKIEIQPKAYYYQWAFIKTASFEPSFIPDVVFKYYNCLECESVELLSSFRFDSKENIWKVRVWPNNDAHLMIGSDNQLGDDVWMYDCLHSIADFNDDKYVDIAIRCRETGEQTRQVKDETLLYTIQKGTPLRIKIKDKTKRAQINRALCMGQESPLCK